MIALRPGKHGKKTYIIKGNVFEVG